MRHWLMKAEPESRLVKGKDVKFSVDDFEAAKTTPWEGVRNAEARNVMKSMRTGDRVLFYHSSCKNPGIAAFAEVSKEGYPDYTAWDPSHPYYDEKTDKENPKWFMVDVTFQKRAPHFVSLSLLKRIGANSPKPPTDVEYIGKEGAEAIKAMALLNRGRLSVQPVEEDAFTVIQKLAETGGWEDDLSKGGRGRKKDGSPGTTTRRGKKSEKLADQQREGMNEMNDGEEVEAKSSHKSKGTKRKATDEGPGTSESVPLRRSTRSRK